ncbi:MAG: scyllo-inositol 2-dehydrogenase (NADP+) [Cyclobacteriaceae bacterium]|jgi:scyllo-inositol 2-dehydrogenase (NADP+)
MRIIKSAILSFGMSGKVFHAPFLDLHPGFEFVGAWERSKSELKGYYPNAKRFNTLKELLEDNSVELVVVNTPTYTHYEYAKLALEANKHVVVEKAFTTTVEEAETLDKLARSRDLKLSVYQNRRWDSDFKTVQKVYESGVLGNPIDVSFSYERFAPNLSPKQHKEVPGPGAGIVKDLGPHVIDQALHLFGFPSAVFAHLAITRPLSEVDDYFKILLFYPSFNVQLSGGYFFKIPSPSFIIHGTNGSFLKSRADVQEQQLLKGMKPNAEGYGVELEGEFGVLQSDEGGSETKKLEALAGDYMKYYDGVYQAIANNKEAPVTAEDGIRVMKIIEAVFKSDLEKSVVALK